jgi:hypothetical protein
MGSRWKFALNAIRSNTRLDRASTPLLGLTGTGYHLEKLDPEHRRGRDLLIEFNIWKNSTTREHFFTWLNKKEKSTGQPLVRMVYRTSKNQQHSIHVRWENGSLSFYDKLYDTTNHQGKRPGYAAFVLSPDNKLFLAEHAVLNDVHASLSGGKRVACAGMIKVEKGKITGLINFSGHYHPELKNLFYAVKVIPKECFAPEARITYQVQRFVGLTKRLQESSYRFVRSIGAWLSRKSKQAVMSRHEFIQFAEKELEKKDNKFIYQRDKHNNRYENTLYESYLAKTIIQNDETWRPLVLQINQWIYQTILQHKNNARMISLLITHLKKHLKVTINRQNFLNIAQDFLLTSENLVPTIMFHGDFVEYIHPKIDPKKSYAQLSTYKIMRSNNLFSNENRGVAATTNWQRGLASYKYPTYRSNALGVMPDKQTPSELAQYFADQPGKRRPTKRFHKLKGSRISYIAAQRNRESKIEKSDAFRKEAIERDISIISGTAGTTSKIIAFMLDLVGLTREEIKDYLMIEGAAVVAYGHHSMYEIMVLARQLGFPIKYDHRFYHEQFVTKEFRKSKAYKDFLASYSQIVAAQIPKPSDKESQMHATYIKVKRALGISIENSAKALDCSIIPLSYQQPPIDEDKHLTHRNNETIVLQNDHVPKNTGP